jgi:hypothetical protein
MRALLLALGSLMLAPAPGAGTAGDQGDLRGQIAALEQELAAHPGADEWEKDRLLKRLDDLRIELGARGALEFRKVNYRSVDGLAIPAYLFGPLAGPPGRKPAVISCAWRL